MEGSQKRRKKTLIRSVQVALSVGVTLAIFVLIIPKIASYSAVWRTITELTWIEFASLLVATIFNLFTYWWQMTTVMPGLTLGQAAVNIQSSTTIANIVPGGGVVAIGVTYAMFSSWGFSGSQIALLVSTTGLWNTFMKLFLPTFALVLLAFTGDATTALLIPALVGLAILAASVLLFGLVLWKKSAARTVGTRVGAAWTRIRRAFHKPPVEDWGEKAVRFRKQIVVLVGKRWPQLTASTIVSHLALYFVLLLTLRHVGVAEPEISSIQVLAVFAFARLLSAAPITPGGIGVVELALIGGLYAAGRNHTTVAPDVFRAQVTAAALLFRVLTYGIQIPLGGFTYMIWQRKKSWRKAVQETAPPGAAVEPVGS